MRFAIVAQPQQYRGAGNQNARSRFEYGYEMGIKRLVELKD